mmetsp:Transcript_43333/g.107045  ORF Transcript_43333/g.107045 Transcript_43333/m.107045 type:complete len:234 (-) Transcript_43333:1071-1772(-)
MLFLRKTPMASSNEALRSNNWCTHKNAARCTATEAAAPARCSATTAECGGGGGNGWRDGSDSARKSFEPMPRAACSPFSGGANSGSAGGNGGCGGSGSGDRLCEAMPGASGTEAAAPEAAAVTAAVTVAAITVAVTVAAVTVDAATVTIPLAAAAVVAVTEVTVEPPAVIEVTVEPPAVTEVGAAAAAAAMARPPGCARNEALSGGKTFSGAAGTFAPATAGVGTLALVGVEE